VTGHLSTGTESRVAAPAGPHGGGRVATAGPPPAEAEGAIVLVHGRGATAESILTLVPELGRQDLAALAPQAAEDTPYPRSWYPQSFLAPVRDNEPGFSSGLAVLAGLVDQLEAEGVPPERTFLLGFSQGACLTAELVARHPRRYAGVALLTGGLLGPPGTPRSYPGSLEGTPIFLGSGDPDPHVPWPRVEETAAVFEQMGAEVTLRRYPGRPHTVSRDELDRVRALFG